MTYRALYREWRPQRFDEVVGQQHVVKTLRNALREDRVAHAYLFSGPRGTGKTSVAKILAKAVNCHQPDGHEPCNSCSACRTITDGTSLDVMEMDAASNRGIDDIRELREGVGYSPAEADRKVYIIDEVHMLSTPAFNALLKTLEEPPEHVIFVLATTDPQKVPTTVTSRCQRFRFHRLATPEIVARLAQVCEAAGVEGDGATLRLIARHGDGSLRDALGILDQMLAFEDATLSRDEVLRVLGKTDEEVHLTLGRHLLNGDAAGVFAVVDELFDSGSDLHQFLLDFLEHLRLLLRIKVVPGTAADHLADEQQSVFMEQADAFPHDMLLTTLDELARVEQAVKWSEHPRILLEVALVDLATRLGGTAQTTAGERSGETAAAAQTGDDPPAVVADTAKSEDPLESIATLGDLQTHWQALVARLDQRFPGRDLAAVFSAGQPAHWDREIATIFFSDAAAKGQAAEAAGCLETLLRQLMDGAAPQVACLLWHEGEDLVPELAREHSDEAPPPAPEAVSWGDGDDDEIDGSMEVGVPQPPAEAVEMSEPSAAGEDELFLPREARRPTEADIETARQHPTIGKLLDEYGATLVAVIEDSPKEDAS